MGKIFINDKKVTLKEFLAFAAEDGLNKAIISKVKEFFKSGYTITAKRPLDDFGVLSLAPGDDRWRIIRLPKSELYKKRDATGSKKPYVVNGKKYRSIRAVAEDYGLSTATLYSRIHQGLSLAEAVNYEPYSRKYEHTNCVIKGKKFRTKRLAAEYYGISYTAVYAEMKRLGVSYEEALISKLNRRNNNAVTIDGITYKSKLDACRRLGLNYNTIRGRLRYGFSIEDAFKPEKYVTTHRDLEKAH